MQDKNLDEFLKEYDASKFNHPSVTTDTLVFSIKNNELNVLLMWRNEMPYKDYWALPGGFVNFNEGLEDNVKRKLKEKVNLENIKVEQLYTFGEVDRDPRTRVISIAYYSLISNPDLVKETEDVKWFGSINDIKYLAFDHKHILEVAIERLRGKLDYTDIAFDLLRDKKHFTLLELRKAYEAILGKKLDVPNFRRMFNAKYVKTGKAIKLNEKSNEFFGRPSELYSFVGGQ